MIGIRKLKNHIMANNYSRSCLYYMLGLLSSSCTICDSFISGIDSTDICWLL